MGHLPISAAAFEGGSEGSSAVPSCLAVEASAYVTLTLNINIATTPSGQRCTYDLFDGNTTPPIPPQGQRFSGP